MSLDTASTQDRLDELRAGHTTILDYQNAYHADEAAEIAEALIAAPQVSHVRLHDLNPKHLPPIAEALATRNDVQELNLSGAALKPEDVEMLLPALRQQHGLEVLNLHGAQMGDAMMVKLADCIRQHLPALKTVNVDNVGIGAQGANALVQSLAEIQGLEIAILRQNNLAEVEAKTMARLVQGKHQLMGLYVGDTGLSAETLAQMEQAMLDTASPNLTHVWMDTVSPTLQAFADHNRKALIPLAKRMENLTAENPLQPKEIWQYERRKGALRYQRWEIPHEKYDTFVQALPPPPRTIELNTLFTADANGYTPLDNPRTWQQHPHVLDALAKRGELTEETMHRQTPHGNSLLEYAFGFLPDATDVVHTLNQNGISLKAQHFVQPDGKPTELMNTLTDRWQCGAMLQKENWVGQPRAALQGFMQAIPEDQQAAIPNRHALLAAVAAETRTARQM